MKRIRASECVLWSKNFHRQSNARITQLCVPEISNTDRWREYYERWGDEGIAGFAKSDSDSPSCLSSLIAPILRPNTNQYGDDMMYKSFRDSSLAQHKVCHTSVRDYESQLRGNTQGTEWLVGLRSYRPDVCLEFDLYFDDSCNAVDPQTVENECGSLTATHDSFGLSYVFSSPISLIWRPSASIEGQTTTVNFKINPHLSNKVFEWKASQDTPLLVFDPMKSGKITSAEQLFGNWTFGGKKTAAIDNSQSPSAGPWRDGYQALKTLDVNGDDKLTGKELDSLALWFDGNQNAASEPGEVIPLANLQVSTIYVTANYTDSSNGNIHAVRGFERIVDGKTIVGRFVDWQAKSADSTLALVNDFLLKEAAESFSKVKKHNFSREERAIAEDSVSLAAKSRAEVPDVGGIWKWKVDDDYFESDSNHAAEGYFILAVTDDGLLIGRSLMQVPLNTKSDTTVKSMLKGTVFQGDYRTSKETGESAFEFTTSFKSGSKIHNTALVDENASVLLGTSVVRSNSKDESIYYRWTARRVR